jgi:hypothetical protein
MADNTSALLSLFGLTASGAMTQFDAYGTAGSFRRTFGVSAPDTLYDATSELQLPASIAPGLTWTSPVLPVLGMKHIAIGITSTQNGTLTIQPYLDMSGLIAGGSAVTQSLTANTAAIKDNAFSTLWQSFAVSISNTGTVAATLSKTIMLLGKS